VIARNLEFLLGAYTGTTTNLWEEHAGYSFFARSVQLRCFREVAANVRGLPVPSGVSEAVDWLESALQQHWNATYYITLLSPVPAAEGSRWVYPINLADQSLGIGPMLGRYPGDTYGLANDIAASQPVPYDALSQKFFAQVAVDDTTSAPAVIASL
jgi:glucoamylase